MMQPYYPSGRVDGSTFFHLIGSHYESISGGYIGSSLCGRLKGPIEDYNKEPAVCAGCIDKAKGIAKESGMEDRNLFDSWSGLNQVIADFRSRFDVLREKLPKCKTKAEAKALIESEGFGERYPLLPDWLPEK